MGHARAALRRRCCCCGRGRCRARFRLCFRGKPARRANHGRRLRCWWRSPLAGGASLRARRRWRRGTLQLLLLLLERAHTPRCRRRIARWCSWGCAWRRRWWCSWWRWTRTTRSHAMCSFPLKRPQRGAPRPSFVGLFLDVDRAQPTRACTWLFRCRWTFFRTTVYLLVSGKRTGAASADFPRDLLQVNGSVITGLDLQTRWPTSLSGKRC